MAKRTGNDDRGFAGADRERQRAITNETGRFASPTGNDSRSTANPRGGAGTGGGATTATHRRSNRGFASMDTSKQREIASKGGKAAHAKGTAHEFDSSEAREAGRKGGLAVSRNREHMAAIGRRGGEARGAARGRGASQTNTGGTGGAAQGSQQNTRSAETPDREVELRGSRTDEASEGVSANTQGNRGGNSAVGGERRPNTLDEARDTFRNHLRTIRALSCQLTAQGSVLSDRCGW